MLGILEDSTALLPDHVRLRSRLERDGYLLLRGVLPKSALADIREKMIAAMRSRYPSASAAHAFDGHYDLLEELGATSLLPARTLQPLGEICSGLLGEVAKSFDFVWSRAVGRGRSTPPHCDLVYMSRGTHRFLSTWIPVVDVPVRLGPLCVLEGSHRLTGRLLDRYMSMDADRLGILNGLRLVHGELVTGGKFSSSLDRVARMFGARWLSADFEVGDLVVFQPRLLHATLPNSGGLRLSIDMRFMPQSEVVDPRFDGPSPMLHADRDWSLIDFGRRLLGREPPVRIQ